MLKLFPVVDQSLVSVVTDLLDDGTIAMTVSQNNEYLSKDVLLDRIVACWVSWVEITCSC